MDAADVTVVGSGPNGLAAAVIAARAGLSVRVVEARPTIGGGARTSELTLPGFRHDVCSAVHPLALASPFFLRFGLAERIPFVTPDISFGHPVDDRRAGFVYRSLDRTVRELGRDGPAWAGLYEPLVRAVSALAHVTSDSLLRIPRHPAVALRLAFGMLEQGGLLRNRRFSGDVAPALFTGAAAHSVLSLPSLGAAGAGLLLGTYAQSIGWPIPLGGSQSIVDAMRDDILAHGGSIETGRQVTTLDELRPGPGRAVVLDVSPRSLLRIGGDWLPPRYASALRQFRYGSAAAKVDFALSEPVPWSDARLQDAGTVHLGGRRAEMEAAERRTARGRLSARPYVLVSQPSRFDDSRAPGDQQVLWAYAHVPRHSAVDPTELITRQIERFAPGFRDVVLASASMSAAQLGEYNANYVGGDISGGAARVDQLIARPVLSPQPWRTPVPGLYLCSSSTPPGPGVHGMGGWHAARLLLQHEFGERRVPDLRPTAQVG